MIENLRELPEVTWIEPTPDPADAAIASETIKLAFVAALQHLPPKQRAVLILCEVLRWQASEAAELLETSVASVNSALQRARATLETADIAAGKPVAELDEADRDLLARYVEAFEAYDVERLTALLHEDATQNMPPYDLWLTGRDDIFTWWFGPGIGCKGSRVIPTVAANGSPAFGQYKPAEGGGYEPWALQVLELRDGGIAEMTFFLDTARLFPLFGLPLAARVLAPGERPARRSGRGRADSGRTPRPNRAPRSRSRASRSREARVGREGARVDVHRPRLGPQASTTRDSSGEDSDEFRRSVGSNR